MKNKTLMLIAMIFIAFYIHKTTSATNVLDMYGSYEKNDSLTIPEMIPVYVGPLYITGGVFDRYYTAECKPTKLGEIQANNILLNGDSAGTFDTFSFKTVDYYKVTTKDNTDTFYVMHMNSNLRGKKFEIVVELRGGPHYDRVIYLFENGKKYMMLYWKDNMGIAVPDKSNEI